METIQEIQKQEFYFDEPLLEYVGIVADEYWPHYEVAYLDDKGSARILDTISDGADMKNIVNLRTDSYIPNIFGRRYVDGKIDTAGKDKYLDNLDESVKEKEKLKLHILDTLNAFELERKALNGDIIKETLDASKFWYLCLCIKDYVMGQTVNALKSLPTPREVMTNLVEEMDKMNPTIMRAISRIDADKGGELTFKLEGEKHKITITDKQTLTLINIAIGEMLELHKDRYISMLDSNLSEVELPYIYRLYLFNKYLSYFLKQCRAKKGVCASKDKSFLISKMIYVLGISDDKRFITEYKNRYKLDHLKNLLKRYKDVDVLTHPSYYYERPLLSRF
nr:MAG: hypothetical protein [Bacteriophage sp.]